MKKPIEPWVFGGAFDPFHFGHLGLLVHLYHLDPTPRTLFLIPSGHPPHKPAPTATAQQRLAMLNDVVKTELAHLTPQWTYLIDPFELNRTEYSRTIDTLRHLNQPVHLIFGSDQFFMFHHWQYPHKILQTAALIVIHRIASKITPLSYWHTHFPQWDFQEKVRWIDMPPIPLSSQDIRKKQAAGESILPYVPQSVAAIILENTLYS